MVIYREPWLSVALLVIESVFVVKRVGDSDEYFLIIAIDIHLQMNACGNIYAYWCKNSSKGMKAVNTRCYVTRVDFEKI